jgi:betaine-aldehyde dehydrogenase
VSAALPVLRNFVGGSFADPADGRTSPVVDPCTGEAYALAPVSSEPDVAAAMAAAAAGFETWRDTTPAERQRALLRLADAVEARAGELVAAECRDTGKPVAVTRADMEVAAAAAADLKKVHLELGGKAPYTRIKHVMSRLG